jgi:CHRD domain
VNRRSTQAVAAGVIALLLAAAGVSMAGADRRGGDFDARLKGFEEVPAVSTVATGSFEAEVNRSAQTIDYKLSYSGLEAAALFAHIHVGQKSVNGGVSAFLCGGGSKPDPCPASSGTVEGTITPADVVGPNAQGVEPGAFAELVRAMEAGVTYANVHSVRWPGGEIRGQIRDDSDSD